MLLTLGKAGVSKAGEDTFIGPTACAIAPNGDIVIADGHWPRPTTAQQDGDRIVRIHEGRQVRRGVRQAGHRAGRVHGSARARVRFARPSVRRRPLEQSRSDPRQGHEVRRRMAALRPTERRGDPARTTRSSLRIRNRTVRSPVRRRRPKAAATPCAIRSGEKAFASAARRTARSNTSFRAPRPKAWPPTSWATSSVGSRPGATRARRVAACRSS